MTSFFGVSRFATAALFLVTAASAGAASLSSQPFVTADAFAQVATMHRGVDVAWQPPWADKAAPQVQPKHFARLREAGFDAVQLALAPFSHMDASGRLDTAWLERLDSLVRAGLDSGMTIVLIEHDDAGCPEDPAACRQKLDGFWRQIGARYKDASAKLLFGIIIEPRNAFTLKQWNVELRKTLATIRQTNPARNVLVGTGALNGVDQLSALDLPAGDKHLVAVVYYFLPLEFTHQGASWNDATKNLSGVTWGSQADRAALAKDFAEYEAWSKAHHRPVFLGAFGAYEKAPAEDRVRWTAAAARTAEANGIPWAYWQFDNNFNVYDIDKDAWIEPILNALIPPEGAAEPQKMN
ncbi:MAG: cellulase family glycosylhydrolase [Rhizomicrobium sp.]|jgi:endoglucanase